MKPPVVLYCKSFSRDVQRAKILLKSVAQFNVDRLPFYISVPSEDVQLFKNTLGEDGYTLILDEAVLGKKLEQSWVTQQTIKSSFWKLNLCENYVMIDSDSYFIRKFYQKDFIVEGTENTPYTVMHEQKDLFSWTIKNTQTLGFDPQLSFAECREPIQQLFDRKGRLYDFGPGPIIWSTKVWSSLEEQYLKPNDLTFEQLVNTVHSEFSWYGEWLLTSKVIPLWPIEPLFKFLHYKQWYEEYKNKGYTLDHWARNYLGVVMQSSSGLPLEY